MKKITFLLFTILATTTLTAQKSIKIGGSMGYSHYLNTSTVDNVETKTDNGAIYLSVFSEIELSKHLNLLPQIQYTTKIEEISIPVQLEFKTKFINFLIGPKVEISTKKLPEDFTNFTVSAIGGLSYNYDKNLKFICNYSYSLTDNYTGNLNIENKTNIISFGLMFNFLK